MAIIMIIIIIIIIIIIKIIIIIMMMIIILMIMNNNDVHDRKMYVMNKSLTILWLSDANLLCVKVRC